MKLWDLFMLKGIRILFGAAMAYLEHLKSKLDEVHDLGKDASLIIPL